MNYGHVRQINGSFETTARDEWFWNATQFSQAFNHGKETSTSIPSETTIKHMGMLSETTAARDLRLPRGGAVPESSSRCDLARDSSFSGVA